MTLNLADELQDDVDAWSSTNFLTDIWSGAREGLAVEADRNALAHPRDRDSAHRGRTRRCVAPALNAWI